MYKFEMAMILMMVMIVAHPILVREIMSQAETQLVTRIGLIIMTYPIVLASIWYSLKTTHYLDDDSSMSWLSIFIFVLLLPVVTYIGFDTGQKVQLHYRLPQEGVSHIATVRECSESKGNRGGRTCHMEYHYEVREANNTTKSYRVRERIPCSRGCSVGFSVDITYLPQTPSQAAISGNIYDLEISVVLLVAYLNLFSILLIRALWAAARTLKTFSAYWTS